MGLITDDNKCTQKSENMNLRGNNCPIGIYNKFKIGSEFNEF